MLRTPTQRNKSSSSSSSTSSDMVYFNWTIDVARKTKNRKWKKKGNMESVKSVEHIGSSNLTTLKWTTLISWWQSDELYHEPVVEKPPGAFRSSSCPQGDLLWPSVTNPGLTYEDPCCLNNYMESRVVRVRVEKAFQSHSGSLFLKRREMTSHPRAKTTIKIWTQRFVKGRSWAC